MGKRDGFGVLFDEKSGIVIYQGEWKNDLYHGNGLL
jgi:hypothetical protein